MSVTARLLVKLQETLGDEATADLITWVDHASDRGFEGLRTSMDNRFAQLEAKFGQFEAKVDARFALSEARLEQRLGELRVEMAAQRADLIKWMFIFWAGTIVPLSGLMVVLIRIGKP